jgi:hypothetical protein
VVVFVAASLASLFPLLIEPRYQGAIPEGHESAAALAVFFALVGLGAALLFVLGLNGFKTSFKRTYAYLYVGIVLHGLSMLAFPILFMFTSLFWTDLPNLLGDGPYLIGTILIFMGLLHFTRLLSLKTWLQNSLLVVPIVVMITALAWLLPHQMYDYSELRFDLVKSILSLECLFSLLSLPLLAKLIQTASFVYTRPLRWLLAAVAANAFAGAVYAVTNYVRLPQDQSVALYNVVGIVYALTQLLFLIAGYSFNRITRASQHAQTGATPFDVITFTANLASQPKAIDTLLDPLRIITAVYRPDQPLDADTLNRLSAIYASLENYLVTEESLRSFTRSQIRGAIQNKFEPSAYAAFFQQQNTV